MSPLSGRTYCRVCDDATSNNPCYYCLWAENEALRVALVEAESKVTVAACLRSLRDEHTERRVHGEGILRRS